MQRLAVFTVDIQEQAVGTSATIFSHFFLRYLIASCQALGFPDSSVGKESACYAGDPGCFLGQEDPLEKGTATHSSILAWRIPWTEWSMGWQRVGHD